MKGAFWWAMKTLPSELGISQVRKQGFCDSGYCDVIDRCELMRRAIDFFTERFSDFKFPFSRHSAASGLSLIQICQLYLRGSLLQAISYTRCRTLEAELDLSIWHLADGFLLISKKKLPVVDRKFPVTRNAVPVSVFRELFEKSLRRRGFLL